MRKIFLIILASILNITVCLSQVSGTVGGNIGVKTVISQDNQYLKITNCDPGYPADISGLKVGDRIYQIDNKKIAELTDPISYLGGVSGTWVKLTINRFCRTDFFDVNVPRISIGTNLNNYISEVSLSALMCNGWIKLNTTTIGETSIITLLHDDSRDMFKYKTYDFEFTSIEDPLQEKVIFNELGSQLNMIGMKRSQENPDLLIIMSFFSGQKAQYVPPQQIISTKIKTAYNWYWGIVNIPVTETVTEEAYTEVTYLTNISLKFLDADEIEGSKTPPVIWSGSISNISKIKYFLTDKCREFLTLMLCQFPEVWQQNSHSYYFNHYAYTGLIYDKSDMQTIFEVIPGSPANKAGIQKGDKILNINKCSLPDNYSYIINDFPSFSLMMNRREPISRTGLRYLYLYADWEEFKNQVEWLKASPNMMTKPYKTDITTLDFKIKRNGKKMTFQVIPEDRLVILCIK